MRLLALARVEDGGSGEEGKETKTTKETDPRIDLPVCEEAAGPGPPDDQDGEQAGRRTRSVTPDRFLPGVRSRS